MISRKTKVLIVDDSALVRRMVTDLFSNQPDIEVVGTAPDAYIARDKILELQPDVITLDIEMPRMDGLTFLKRLMHFRPMPVVILSSVAGSGGGLAMEALRAGAVEVLAKPSGPMGLGELGPHLLKAVRAAARARVSRISPDELPATPSRVSAASGGFFSQAAILIGASTGGVEAIREVLTRMPANAPPILIVQHIPPSFSSHLAEHLNRICPLEVMEAQANMELLPGRVLLAPGGRHMEVRHVGAKRCVVLTMADPVNRHRPSVDVLFHSMLKCGPRHSVAVLLTGMGSDGASGMLALRKAGAATIAQDEQSSVVFGMPAEAVRLGAVEVVLPLKDIAGGIVKALTPSSARPGKSLGLTG